MGDFKRRYLDNDTIMAVIAPNTFSAQAAPNDANFETYSQIGGVNSKASVSALAKGVQGYMQGFAQKTANDTRTSTTLTNDTHLIVAVTPGTYLVRMDIYYTGDTASDINMQFAIPAGTTGTLSGAGIPIGAASTSGSGAGPLATALDIAAAFSFGAITSTKMAARISGYVTITTAGNITLQTANLAGTTTLTIHTGSFLLLEKIL
jgi:hypothetical protein